MSRPIFKLTRLAAICALAASATAARTEPLLVMFFCDGEDRAEVAEIVAFEVLADETIRALSHPQAQLVETPKSVTLVEADGRVIHIAGDDSFMSKGGVVHALTCRDATGQLGPVAMRLAEKQVGEAEAEVARLRASHVEALARIAELQDAARQREQHEGW